MSITEDHEGELNVYEIGYSILPSIPEDKLTGVVESIKKTVSKNGGSFLDSENPHLRPLAYEMRKTVGASKYIVKEAYFGWLKFEGEGANVGSITAGIKKINEVLRFLLIKAPKETSFTFAKAMDKERRNEGEFAEDVREVLAEVTEKVPSPEDVVK